MFKLNFNKPSHIMITWACLTVTGAMFYNVTKNGIYLRKRQFAVPSETIPSQVNQMSWEERIAQDEANAAKKGYKVDYRSIHETSTANAKDA
ncbi:MAG: hypothetical protein J3R72DRAFT_492257 [Linnemannia gamsii]|nr:MAG: hypothetical protein J3R72DRAFT_492257 [Linnemannia gamsii]